MVPLRILIDVPAHPPGMVMLESLGQQVSVDVWPEPEERSRPLPAERLRDVDLLFCTFPPSNFADLARVRWIQIASTGYAQLFGLGLTERGIAATNGRGCFDVPIAEWNVAMMVNLARDVRGMIRNQDAALWDRGARFQREIRGMTLGLWGYGGIGRQTARLARALGMRVHVLTRGGAIPPRENVYRVEGTGDWNGTLPHRVFRAGDEDSFLRELDFLVVSLPLTKATEGLIGERELRALPRSAFLLNPARGPIVQQAALLRALDEGWISGAALDTHYVYPLPPEHPLWRYPNVILTPHISGSSMSQHFRDRVWDIFGKNLRRYLAGQELLNRLTPAELAGD
ncbi:MAG: D-2-hydroxyacid dehydrogenase [Acidobacteria bacterium]|nr:D-2-hydroxyacid dehydrogenase [Acidobacteriota bacterium]